MVIHTTLCYLIKDGKDAVSKTLSGYLPSEEDYNFKLGTRKFEIGREIRTKPGIEEVKAYVKLLDESLPKNYKVRNRMLGLVALRGIRDNEEFMEKEPTVYVNLIRYIKVEKW